jgi:DNA processing protein
MNSAPPIPLRTAEIPSDLPLRGSDRRLLTDPYPGLEEAARLERHCGRLGIRIETPGEDPWLDRLWRELADPPAALYIKGQLQALEDRAVGVVGSRTPSESGITLATELARDLAASGVTIVSGLALGIDGAAHRGALQVAGRTIAVLGGGLDHPTPPSHNGLAARVACSGGLVSEFPPGVDPRPMHFPRRNRLIAALAQVLIVVEGGARSGARSTVDHAIALGREVAAVPRDPLHEGSALPNLLLRQGATPVTSASEVLALLDQGSGARPREPEHGGILSAEDRAVLDRLRSGARRAEQLGGQLAIEPHELIGALGRLTLAGRVVRLPGGRYACAGDTT